MISLSIPEDLVCFQCGEHVLLLNCCTCTWARIHETEYKQIKALVNEKIEKIEELPPQARTLLVNHLLYVQDHTLKIPQKRLLEYLDHPRIVYYAVTNRCNLHCVYCYADGGHEKKNELTTKEALHLMEEVASLGVETVVFTGGEPLLCNDLYKLAQKVHDQGMKTALITNGTLIDEDNVNTLVHQFDRITLSLDSKDASIHNCLRGPHTCEKTLESLLLLTQCTIPVHINITLTHSNQCNLTNTLTHIISHQLGIPRFSPYLLCGRGEQQDLSPSLGKLWEELPQIFQLLYKNGLVPLPEKRVRHIHCGMGHAEFGISADGHVYPCRLLQVPELCAGKVGNTSLRTLYYTSESFQKARNLTVDTLPQCCTCAFRNFCGGGCRAAGYYATGDLRGVDPLSCLYNKVKTLFSLWAATGFDFKGGAKKCIQNAILL